MHRSLPVVVIVAAALGLVVAAQAQTLPRGVSDSVAGNWRFETEMLPDKGCRIDGEMTFRRLPLASAAWSCEFLARETCSNDTFQIVRQTCSARLEDGEIAIVSEVEEVVDAGPVDRRAELMRPGAYRPDNFTVAPPRNGEMRGHFFSIRRAPVRFWRTEELIS